MGEYDAEDFLIAPSKRVSHWRALRLRLGTPFSQEAWEEAFDEFLMGRLESRYFSPISAIERDRSTDGAGFSVVTIYCSLIEFLQALNEGREFKHGEVESPEIYSDSQAIFVRFLTGNPPFSDWFTKNKAKKFYSNVRCALFHEARIRSPWLIKLATKQADQSASIQPINCDEHRIYRDRLKGAFGEYLRCYREKLLDEQNVDVRSAFVRKFNALCE